MSNAKIVDPFVSTEPDVKVDAETSRILKQRTKTVRERPLVPAEEARQQIKQWLSKSSATKMR